MKKSTAIVPIVALLLGATAPSVQAAPLDSTPSTIATSGLCQDLPKSEPWANHPTHVWNVVWRNKVALCGNQAKLGSLQSTKVQPVAPQASKPTAPVMPIAQGTDQPIVQNP